MSSHFRCSFKFFFLFKASIFFGNHKIKLCLDFTKFKHGKEYSNEPEVNFLETMITFCLLEKLLILVTTSCASSSVMSWILKSFPLFVLNSIEQNWTCWRANIAQAKNDQSLPTKSAPIKEICFYEAIWLQPNQELFSLSAEIFEIFLTRPYSISPQTLTSYLRESSLVVNFWGFHIFLSSTSTGLTNNLLQNSSIKIISGRFLPKILNSMEESSFKLK